MTTANTTGAHYRLLGVDLDADLEEIRAAYRAMLRRWHPDLVADKPERTRRAATDMTAKLNAAYECLADSELRAAYDTNELSDTATTGHTSRSLLTVSPPTLTCELTPGDTVSLTFDIHTDDPEGGGRPRVRTTSQLEAVTFTTTTLTTNSARITVRAATSKLRAELIYYIPIVVTWGNLTGTATLIVYTTRLRKLGPKSSNRRPPTSAHRRRTQRADRRIFDLVAIIAAGIVLPLFLLVWRSDMFPDQAAANLPVAAAVGTGIVGATFWLLAVSRLLRRPERLSRIGVVWSHLSRGAGRALVAGCAALVVTPALIIILTAGIAVPFLGIVILVSSRVHSHNRQ